MDAPDNFPLVDEQRGVTLPWNRWFQWVQAAVVSIYASGVSADRPTKLLWVGRQFWDTTLGKPIYVSAVKPTVWVDATGAVVP